MTFGNEIGCEVTVPGDLSTETLLFSETGGFVVETIPDNEKKVKSYFEKQRLEITQVGSTTDEGSLKINKVVQLPVCEAKEAWVNGLRNRL